LKRKVHLESWNRKSHFELFQTFEEPYFGLVADVDCTNCYKKAKKEENPFFISYLHKILKTVNQIEEFKYRIIGEEVFCYDSVHGSSTVARKDNTFGFSNIRYHEDFSEFLPAAIEEIDRIKNGSNLELNHELNIIHFTAIPWLKFTSLSHPRRFSINESIPKISTGKISKVEGKLIMPVAVHAHHGLVDGYHVGKFFEIFQKLLNS
jgi:chloramphenicol O-acetyltransferase type A